MKIIKILICFGLITLGLGIMGNEEIKAEHISEEEMFYADLDGDGKEEKIKYVLTGEKFEDDDYEGYAHYLYKIYINDKVELKGNVGGKAVYLYDYNPKDKYIDLLIVDNFRDDSGAHIVYRYKNKKLSVLFDASEYRLPYGKFHKEQDKSGHVVIENRRSSILGEFYIREEYKVKKNKLVYVKPPKYEVNVHPGYYDDETHWYILAEPYMVWNNDETDYVELESGTLFTVTKLRVNVVADRKGHTYPQISEAYIITADGIEGWLHLLGDFDWYESKIVENAIIYGM